VALLVVDPEAPVPLVPVLAPLETPKMMGLVIVDSST
jgi:hypothetical protein